MADGAGAASLYGGLFGGLVGLGGGIVEAQAQRRASTRARRRARRQTAFQIQQTLASPEVARARQFFGDIFGEAQPGGATDVLSTEFRRGLQQAQASRGLFQSQAAAGAEATGLAAFRARLQSELLPQLLEFGALPSTLEQTFGGANLTVQQRALGGTSSLALGGLSGLISGAGSGAALGLDIYSLQQRDQELLRARQLQERLGGTGGVIAGTLPPPSRFSPTSGQLMQRPRRTQTF